MMKRHNAFTLIELLVVIAIIAIPSRDSVSRVCPGPREGAIAADIMRKQYEASLAGSQRCGMYRTTTSILPHGLDQLGGGYKVAIGWGRRFIRISKAPAYTPAPMTPRRTPPWRERQCMSIRTPITPTCRVSTTRPVPVFLLVSAAVFSKLNSPAKSVMLYEVQGSYRECHRQHGVIQRGQRHIDC